MTRRLFFSLLIGGLLAIASCEKEEQVFPPKTILYIVKGSHLKLNYIDSQSIFKQNQLFADSFRDQFKKGPGASIGITVNRGSDGDSIYSWQILIDGKLYANAFREGGAYFTVPYN